MRPIKSHIILFTFAAILALVGCSNNNGQVDDTLLENTLQLSDASQKYLKNIDEPLIIRVYLDGSMPDGYKRLRSETRKILNQFHAYNKNITFEFIDPNNDKEFNNEEREAIYLKMARKGIYPVQEQTKESRNVQTYILLPGAELSYKGRSTAISLIHNQQYIDNKSDVINNSIQNLEYTFISAIYNLSRLQKPSVAFLQGHGELSGTAIYSIVEALNEFYSVDTVNINGQIQSLTTHTFNEKDSSYRFTNKYDVLIVAKPTQRFSDQDLFIIDQYIMYGGKVLWLIDPMNADMDNLSNKGQFTATRYSFGGMEEMLLSYGVRINDDILMDIVSQFIPMPVRGDGNTPGYELRPWFYFPEIVPRSEHPIVKNLDLVKAEFISSIDTINNDIQKTILLSTSEFTRIKNAPAIIDVTDALTTPDKSQYNRSHVPVAVLLEGEFNSAFRNRLAPQFAAEKSIGVRGKSDPTKMIVVSDGDIIKNRYDLQSQTIYPIGYDIYTKNLYANRELILNMLNYMTGDTDIMALRNNVKR